MYLLYNQCWQACRAIFIISRCSSLQVVQLISKSFHESDPELHHQKFWITNYNIFYFSSKHSPNTQFLRSINASAPLLKPKGVIKCLLSPYHDLYTILGGFYLLSLNWQYLDHTLTLEIISLPLPAGHANSPFKSVMNTISPKVSWHPGMLLFLLSNTIHQSWPQLSWHNILILFQLFIHVTSAFHNHIIS